MKNFAFVKILALFVAAVFVFSSCTWFEKTPEVEDFDDLLKEGLSNLSDVRSAEYSFFIGGEIESDSGVTFSDSDFSSFILNMSFDGAFDARDKDNMLFSLVLDLDLKMDDEIDENASAEVRFVRDTLYLALQNLSDLGGEIPQEMIAPFMGQWWSLEMGPEFTESLDFVAEARDEEEMTPEQKQLADLFDETDFFTEVRYLGTERVGRDNAHKYFAVLDKDATAEYLIESSRIMDTPLSQEEIDEGYEYMEGLDFEGYFWIGVNDETFRKFEGTLTVEDVEGVSSVLSLSLEVSNLNGNITVEEPEESEDLEQVLMMLLGGAF